MSADEVYFGNHTFISDDSNSSIKIDTGSGNYTFGAVNLTSEWLVIDTLLNPSSSSSYIFNNTNETYNGFIHFYGITDLLCYDSDGIICNGSSADINSNDGNLNITIPPNKSIYVLDDYSAEQGSTRPEDPITVGEGTQYEKPVTSDLNETIQTDVVFDSYDTSAGVGRVLYTNSLGQRIFFPEDYTILDNYITLNTNVTTSDTITVSYGCSTLSRVGFRIIAIFAALLLPLYMVYYMSKKGWENITLQDILIFFVAIVIGVGLVLASWQNLGGACGVVAT